MKTRRYSGERDSSRINADTNSDENANKNAVADVEGPIGAAVRVNDDKQAAGLIIGSVIPGSVSSHVQRRSMRSAVQGDEDEMFDFDNMLEETNVAAEECGLDEDNEDGESSLDDIEDCGGEKANKSIQTNGSSNVDDWSDKVFEERLRALYTALEVPDDNVHTPTLAKRNRQQNSGRSSNSSSSSSSYNNRSSSTAVSNHAAVDSISHLTTTVFGTTVEKSTWDKLFAYQKEGIQWMYNLYCDGLGGILVRTIIYDVFPSSSLPAWLL
jgi:hypothetical protein